MNDAELMVSTFKAMMGDVPDSALVAMVQEGYTTSMNTITANQKIFSDIRFASIPASLILLPILLDRMGLITIPPLPNNFEQGSLEV